MTSKDEQIRAAIVEQAAEWLVANDEEPRLHGNPRPSRPG